jgi:hypothetical protein
MLVPIGQWLFINGANASETPIMEIAGKRTSNKPAGAGNYDQIILLRIPGQFEFCVCIHLDKCPFMFMWYRYHTE